jgi:DNA polymerase III subunit gamma/tau
MLETAIASLDGKVSETEVASILGVASRSRVFGIVEAVLGKDAAAALGTVRELYRSGANLESLGRDILELLRNLAVAKLPDASGTQSPLADLPDQEAAELKRLAATASNRDLMRLFHLMADAQEQLIRSPYPDLLLEMAVIRMATLAPVIDADELLRAIGAGGSAKGVVGGGNTPGSASPSSPVAGSTGPLSGTVKAAPTSPLTESVLAPAPSRRIKVEGEVKAEAPARRSTPPQTVQRTAPSVGASVTAGASVGLPELRDFIRSRRAALFGFMEQGAALDLNGDVLTIIPRNDIYVRYLSDNRGVIADLASELYGRRVRAEISEVGTPMAPHPDAASPTVISDAPISSLSSSTASSTAGLIDAVDVGAADSAENSQSAGAAINGVAAALPDQMQAAGADPDADASASSSYGGVAGMSQAELKQSVYGDPIVRRIFDEFQARLIEVRAQPAAASAAGGLAPRKP